MLSNRSCPQLAAAPLVRDTAGDARIEEVLDRRKAGAPEQPRLRVEQHGGSARGQQLDFARRDVRAGDGPNIGAETADFLKQLDLPDLAAEMFGDHQIEFGRLGDMHVKPESVVARDAARFTEALFVQHLVAAADRSTGADGRPPIHASVRRDALPGRVEPRPRPRRTTDRKWRAFVARVKRCLERRCREVYCNAASSISPKS